MLLILITLIVLGLYLSLKTPTNDANWQTQFQVLPTVEMAGDRINIKNMNLNKPGMVFLILDRTT